MFNLISTIGSRLAWFKRKRFFALIGFILLGVGIVFFSNERSLFSRRNILLRELSLLKISEDLLLNLYNDFDKLNGIDLNDPNETSWITEKYLRESYYFNGLGDIVSRISSQEFRKICIQIAKTTHGVVTCDNFETRVSFIDLIKDLRLSEYKFDTFFNSLEEHRLDILSQIKDNEKSISSFHTFDFLGSTATLLGGFVLLVTLIVYILDFIDYSRKRLRQDVEDVQKAQRDLSLGQSPWKNATKVLEAYYSRNLGQTGKIFVTSIIVMLAGFLVVLGSIIAGIYISIAEQSGQESQGRLTEIVEIGVNLEGLTEKQLKILLDPPENASLVISLIGTSAGIITSFIGATFLYLYQITLKQSSEYTTSLARTNTIGISMEILSTIKPIESTGEVTKETNEKVESAKIEIAQLLIKQLQNLNKDEYKE